MISAGNRDGLFNRVLEPPPVDLNITVVIPSFCEPDVLTTLESLRSASTPPEGSVEVLVWINHPESASMEIQQTSLENFRKLREFSLQNRDQRIRIHPVLEVLPDQHAGVGLARKRAMDAGVYRYETLGKEGIIVNLDADCTVESNYLKAIWDGFQGHPEWWAASIYFEHKLDIEPDPLPIQEYELHLRYFIAAQRWLGLPFAYQTLGSSMAIRSSAYRKVGGMNTRQAGEDFYFLHKFSAIDRLGDLLSTTVYPSGRRSERVPFGTGRAMINRERSGRQLTYNLQSFLILKPLIESLKDRYQGREVASLPPELETYKREIDFEKKWNELRSATAQWETFRKRFFQWFNAFRLMKYLHFMRSFYPDVPVFEAANSLKKIVNPGGRELESQKLLYWYREKARVH